MTRRFTLFVFLVFNNQIFFAHDDNVSSGGYMPIGRFSHEDVFDKMLVNKIISNAPRDIKRIVFNLIYPPNSLAAIPKRLLLIGEPGTGKTSLAKAIALKCRCEYYIIEAPFLLNEYKNCGQQNLLREIVPLLESGKPIVIIIDEITELTNNYGKKNNSDSTVVSALWLLLDLCAQYDNVFFIGTSNKTRKDLPAQLRSRFDEDIVTIPVPNSAARMKILDHHLRFEKCDFDYAYHKYLVRKTAGRSVREIEKLVLRAIQYANVSPSVDYVVSKKHFEKALRVWKSLWHPQVLYERNEEQIKLFFGTALPIILQAISTFSALYFGVKQEWRAAEQMTMQKVSMALQEQSFVLQKESFEHQVDMSAKQYDLQCDSFEHQKNSAGEQKGMQETGLIVQKVQTGISVGSLLWQIISRPGGGFF